jgi:hypothetical protein
MDWVTAKIALGGEATQVLYRGPDRPVSWPEVLVLQALHGESNVFDADFLMSQPSNIQEEKNRLLGLYGKDIVDQCYPGSRPAMELQWPGERDESAAVQKRAPRRPLPSADDDEPVLDMTRAQGSA